MPSFFKFNKPWHNAERSKMILLTEFAFRLCIHVFNIMMFKKQIPVNLRCFVIFYY